MTLDRNTLLEAAKAFDRWWRAGYMAMRPIGGQPHDAEYIWTAAWEAALAAAQPEGVVVPMEIDRSKHRKVLLVWNECMANHETLETTWPRLVDAMLGAQEGWKS